MGLKVDYKTKAKMKRVKKEVEKAYKRTPLSYDEALAMMGSIVRAFPNFPLHQIDSISRMVELQKTQYLLDHAMDRAIMLVTDYIKSERNKKTKKVLTQIRAGLRLHLSHKQL